MNIQKKKILISAFGFFPAQRYGGPPVSIENFCNHMEEYEIYIIARDHDLFDKARLDEIHDGWNNRGNCKVLYLADNEFTTRKFKSIIEEIQPNLVYIQSFFQARTFLCAALAAKKYNIPVLLSPRGELCSGAMRKKYKKIPYIILLRIIGIFNKMYFQATSKEEHQMILHFFMAEESRIFDLSNFPSVPSEVKENVANTINPERIKLVSMSRIVPQKNILYACNVIKEVSCQVDWDIYGQIEDNDYWEECKKVIETFPKNVNVTYKGNIKHDEVSQVLRAYNVFFLPTRSENFGHAIVEAMYAGCIPIISDQTPWNDISKEQVGYAINLSNKEDFISAITNLHSKELYNMSRGIQRYILKKLQLQELEEKYKVAIEEISK